MLAAGEPLRLHHVVELPPRDAAEALGGLRRISPAVGQAAKAFTEETGRTVEILDLRSLSPYDWEAIARSVQKTSRVLVVYEDSSGNVSDVERCAGRAAARIR